MALSGAGCSTDSGIPDYGGLHSTRRRRTVQYRPFVSDPVVRARYWFRSAVGWPRVSDAQPNAAHRALSALERAGIVLGVITQNVDGLHQRAGTQRVVELHGSLSRVRCLDCQAVESRAAFQERLHARNPHLPSPDDVWAPDGDADVEPHLETFHVPPCGVCGGTMKPDVVFFGENIPKSRVNRAWDLYGESDVLLVVGSSLAVFSGFRFVLRADRDGRPIVIANDGPTRGDAYAAARVSGRLSTLLPNVVQRIGAVPMSQNERTPA